MAKENPGGTQKRAAPITASAFSFTLNTPKNKKSNATNLDNTTPLSSVHPSNQTPSKVKREYTTPQAPRLTAEKAIPEPNQRNQDVKGEYEPLQPISNPSETPRRALSFLKPLNAFATPLKQEPKTGDPGPSSSRTLRRLNERIGDVTPLKEREQDAEIPTRPRFALHETLLSDKTAESLLTRKRAALLEEDEGLGVSPRGKRIAKWSGNSAPPPSVHLANLLSSSNSSLHLFYTSMQHLLYPSQHGTTPLPRYRQPKNEVSGNTLPSISPFQHIQASAKIQLKIVKSIEGPTHSSSLFWCQAVKWNDKTLPDQWLPVVFQPLPNECPKLGIDPRLLAMKMNDQGEKEWYAGIWAWSEVEMPSNVSDQNNFDYAEVDEIDSVASITVPVLIVTRYLIVPKPVV
ncbi:uncharacterized protein L201_002482 [Kwoniella dendrophila CBS 6074]|uniref:Uncharacterized protein n=1 Tax=Kwoniella dendrophila CBS 6074 TaxID=1295534 RepID=A0AAX4JQ99_9TREE